ncbi:unnamed protein product [Malus baccata var. baccata]
MVPVIIRYSDDSHCVISQEEKNENRESVEFQIVIFTNRIRRLTSHLQLHKKKRDTLDAVPSYQYSLIETLDRILIFQKKNYLSQRGLRKIMGKRQRLLSYLSKKNRICYKELINRLDIRESKTR